MRRIPMFYKFLAGCVTLALLLIAGGSYVVHQRMGSQSRSENLEKNLAQYLRYQADIDQAMATLADVLAHDDALRRALSARAAGGPRAGGDRGAAADLAAAQFARLRGEDRLGPDFLLLFDGAGRLLFRPPGIEFTKDELARLGAAHRVRSGAPVQGKIAVHRGRAYQLVGTPVYGPDGASGGPGGPAGQGAAEPAGGPIAAGSGAGAASPAGPGADDVVGGIVLGTDVSHAIRRYEDVRNTWRSGIYRLVLAADGQVVAAAVPDDRWPALSMALRPEARRYVAEADEGQQGHAAIDFDDDLYYLLAQDVDGYRGLDLETVGQMFLLRRQLRRERASIPWTEVFIGLVLAIVIASVLAVWITRPIKRFVEQSQNILEGETDLTQRIELRSRDETRDLADNINQVFARLYELASDVQSAAFQVGASSAEISAASKEMAGGLKDQTLKIEGSTAAVTELSASIQQVAANAAEATQVAEKSNESVSAAVTRMQEIRDAVEDAAEKMHELGESSKRIGNIVEVIRQISEQTSLLALNASIEAAHAGEQGRGFAVVADEVSSLARRVGQSAKDIEALIQTIKEQTAEAVHSMQVGSREVEGGTELVTVTLTDLKTLIGVVKDTAAAVQEQAVVSDEIARNMDAVQTIAAEMLSGSEESVGQAEQLHELAFQLEQSVGGFNLDAGGGHLAAGERAPKRLATHSEGRARDAAGRDPGRGGRA